MKLIYIINGPNLDLIHLRDFKVYGGISIDKIEKICKETADKQGYKISFHQSDSEGELIEIIHSATNVASGIVINPGAYTHYSIALRDALELFKGPKVEVHLSNIFSRENFRRISVTGEVCDMVIAGGGVASYELAILWLGQKIAA